MRRLCMILAGVVFLFGMAVLHAEDDEEKAEKGKAKKKAKAEKESEAEETAEEPKAEKKPKAEKAEKESEAEPAEKAEESEKPAKAAAEPACAKALPSEAPCEKRGHYYEGNRRKSCAGPRPKRERFPGPETGKAATSIPALSDADQGTTDSLGGHYHHNEGGSGRVQTRTMPASPGMRRMEPGVMLPAQSFTVSPGIGIVPYTPLSDAGVRAVTPQNTPYYPGNKGRYKFPK